MKCQKDQLTFYVFRSENENHQLRLKIFRCVRNQIKNNHFTFTGTGAGAAGSGVSKGSTYFLFLEVKMNIINCGWKFSDVSEIK